MIALAKNGPNNGGMSGGGMKQGNQVQVQEPKKNQNQVQEPVNTPTQLQEQKKTQTQLQECEEECNQNCEEKCNGECTGDCDDVPLEINAAQYKDMTIAEIADVWGINADTLLNDVEAAFSLDGDYNIDNTLDDLRENNLFSPSDFVDFMEENYSLNS